MLLVDEYIGMSLFFQMSRLLKVIILGEERASECVHMREERERERESPNTQKSWAYGVGPRMRGRNSIQFPLLDGNLEPHPAAPSLRGVGSRSVL